MRISDWSSDVCSSDLRPVARYNLIIRPGRDPRGIDTPSLHDVLIAVQVERVACGQAFGSGVTLVARNANMSIPDGHRHLLTGPANLEGGTENRRRRIRSCNPERMGGIGRHLERSEERRGGKECGSTCSTRWSPD